MFRISSLAMTTIPSLGKAYNNSGILAYSYLGKNEVRKRIDVSGSISERITNRGLYRRRTWTNLILPCNECLDVSFVHIYFFSTEALLSSVVVESVAHHHDKSQKLVH